MLGDFARMSFYTLILAILVSGSVAALASPRDDLTAASQQTRDDAGKTLRATFVMPARERWDALVATIKPGDTKDSFLERLRPFNATSEMGVGSGQTSTESYRLDDAWVLSCSFVRRDGGEFVLSAELREQLRHIWVPPPADFTGLWAVYFVNGQRSHEIHYAEGHYFGEFTAFRSDGSKVVVQHYDATGCNGEDTGYFPSGRIMYRAFYKNNSPVGTWTHYNEDGSVRSTQEHPTPHK